MRNSEDAPQIREYSSGSLERDNKPLAELDEILPADIKRRANVYLVGPAQLLIEAQFNPDSQHRVEGYPNSLTIECPFCHEEHRHHWGATVLGGIDKVESACPTGRGPDEYYLVLSEPSQPVPPEIIHWARKGYTDNAGNTEEPLVPPEIDVQILRQLGLPHW